MNRENDSMDENVNTQTPPTLEQQIDSVIERLNWLQEAPIMEAVPLYQKQQALAVALQAKAILQVSDRLDKLLLVLPDILENGV
jgi:hypothetical protein